MIERAIRASVQQLQASPGEADHESAVNRAIQASIAETRRGKADADAEREHHQELAHSLKQSLHILQADTDWAYKDTDLRVATEGGGGSNEPGLENQEGLEHQTFDPELQKALTSSQQSHAAHLKEREKSDAEEDIVLRYVQRLSAFEESQKRSESKSIE